MGAQALREFASKTSDRLGDGTSTATVVAQAIVREGAKAVGAGMNPMDLTRGSRGPRSCYSSNGRAVHQRRRGRDQAEVAVVPLLHRYRGPPSASCARLQSRQLHANACDTLDGGTVVAY